MRRISFKQLILVVAMICFVCIANITPCFASSLDELGDSENHTSTSEQDKDNSGNGGNSVSDYLSGHTPVTDENMQTANELAGPLATAIGTITGVVLIIVSAAIFLITAFDLAYIGIPPLRHLLNPNYMQQQQGGGSMPMAGGYGMRGGYGMMGGGMQAQQPVNATRPCLVSDEAIAAVNLANPQPQAAGGMPMGGMGMGMGMGMMGGGMQPQQAQPMPTKSVAFTYLKKRMFFIIIFTVCMIILMSSVLTDCGINLAQLLSKVLDKLNGSMSNISM